MSRTLMCVLAAATQIILTYLSLNGWCEIRPMKDMDYDEATTNLILYYRIDR